MMMRMTAILLLGFVNCMAAPALPNFSDFQSRANDPRITLQGPGLDVTTVGADRTGVKDSAGVIQAALNTTTNTPANGGVKRLFFPDGTYHFSTNGITIPTNVVFESYGATLDFSSATNATPAIIATGGLTDLPTIYSNVAIGATSIVFAAAHGLAVGDLIAIQNTNDYSWKNGVGARQYYNAGEKWLVSTVPTTTNVTVNTPAWDNYTAGANIKLWKINPITVGFSKVKFKFASGLGAGVYGMQISLGKDCFWENLDMRGSQAGQLFADRHYNGQVANVVCFDNEATIGENYGIAFTGSQKVNVFNLSGETARHLLTFGAGSVSLHGVNAGGVNRDITIQGGHYGSQGTSWSLDFGHGIVEHATVNGVTAVGGIIVGGDDITVEGNDIGNWNASGYAVAAGESAGFNYKIRGNNIFAVRNFDNGLTDFYARSNTVAASAFDFSGNNLNMGTFVGSTYPSSGITSGIEIGTLNTPPTTNIVVKITGNTFITSTTTAGPLYGVYLDPSVTFGLSYVEVKGNTFIGCGGVYGRRNINMAKIQQNKIWNALEYGINTPVTAGPAYTNQTWEVDNNDVVGAQKDGIRLVGETNTWSLYVRNNTSKNNGLLTNLYYSIVVDGVNTLWMTGNYFGDESATPTQVNIDSINTVTHLRSGLNFNVGAGKNSLVSGTLSAVQYAQVPQINLGRRAGVFGTNYPVVVGLDMNAAVTHQYENLDTGSGAALLVNLKSSSGSGGLGSYNLSYGTANRRDKAGVYLNSDATALGLWADNASQTVDMYAGSTTLSAQVANTSFLLGANVTNISLNGILIGKGTGTPEANFTAPVGSHFIRTDGGAATSFYVKESGSGSTGWIGK